ncbi:MAG: exodeoxyribonuclease V subunit gamma [Gammaproteobacteria bacterium]|nr:exodeoxyribonuclease V subunit gamma [Gammaproteobacteria bacterium]
MLKVCHGNRLELLADRLAEAVSAPLPLPLQPEVVVVENPGMARWLSLRLAERLGVCANIEFFLPGRFIWEVFRGALPRLPESSPFRPEVLVWRIVDELGRLPKAPVVAPLHRYLETADEGGARYLLAQRIARCFDQYLLFRPDWLRRWEEGGETGAEERWQAWLWRRLAASGGDHWLQVRDRFRAALERGEIPPQRLPPRFSLFGIAALSPGYLDLVAALSRHLPVRLFLLNPCRQYWGDIESRKRGARQEAAGEALYLETGNSLLASLGRQGRDFLDLVWEQEMTDEACFEVPSGAGALPRLQRDLLDLRQGEGRREADDSVQIHACHSRMREMEVLYDRLLDLLERHPDLSPSDIAVMAPDIEVYAPYVEAVFGTAAERRLPYAIADRRLRAAGGEAAETFLLLLDLPEGRLAAEQVLGLLEAAAVRERFGIEAEDLPLLRGWLEEAGVRWGWDGDDRRRLELPPEEGNTWRVGLDRLLLGYAMEPDGIFSAGGGIVPLPGLEGGEAGSLGRLCTLVRRLVRWRQALVPSRSLAAWAESLTELLGDFFAEDGEERQELRLLRGFCGELRERGTQAGFAGKLSLAELRAFFRERLEREASAGRFLGGGITFCRMAPMRGIPFAVLCLVGMDFDSYPRRGRPPDFDLMRRRPRRGDRSPRGDDRYLFLEALLSCRRCLYLSYVGQDIRDNSALPPSILIGELLEYLGADAAAGGRDAADRWTLRHPLQAFSGRYFASSPDAAASHDGGRRLFSYSREHCDTSRVLQGRAAAPCPLVFEVPEDDAPGGGELEVEELRRFLRHPVRHLLRRLGIRPPRAVALLGESEPFALTKLERYRLREELFRLALAGKPLAAARAEVLATGRVPHGGVGECLLRQEEDALTLFRRAVTAAAGELLPPPAPGPLVLAPDGGVQPRGAPALAGADGLLFLAPRPPWQGEWPALWLRHLLRCRLEGADTVSRLFWWQEGRLRQCRLLGVADAARRLRELLQMYRLGRCRPLHLFPKSSRAFAEAERDGKDAWRQAGTAWQGSEHVPGEAEDFYCRVAFRDLPSPLDREFERLSRQLYAPLLEHCRED